MQELIKSKEYDFLRTNEHLGPNIILLGLGGSHAYGTNVESSDIDIRGIALNSKSEILTGHYFEQVLDDPTDTVVYSFNKIVGLLAGCNPNTIEILGLKPEHYLYLSDIGKELLDNKKMFLSQRAIVTFGGYSNQQLRRLDNKAVRQVNQSQREQHILNSVENAKFTFPEKYFYYPEDAISLYIDESSRDDYDTEIFMDINLKHYPLRDYKSMWSEMNNIVKDYSKIGKRNKNAIMHDKITKHMMHLVRLFFMCFDILEKEEINTYREKEYDLLMSIRNGDFVDGNSQPTKEFYEMLDELEKRMEYAKANTSLPEKANMKRINEFVMSVNERVVKGEI